MRITLKASGDYAYEVPESLMTALVESVRSHMAAYGLTRAEAKVEIEPAVKDCLAGGEPSGDRAENVMVAMYATRRHAIRRAARSRPDAFYSVLESLQVIEREDGEYLRAAMKEKP